MGIRSNDEITKARRIGTVWMIISYVGTFLIGTMGTAYLLKHGILLGTGSEEIVVNGVTQFGDAETVFSATMLKMYPAFIGGIFLCAILAASMISVGKERALCRNIMIRNGVDSVGST